MKKVLVFSKNRAHNLPHGYEDSDKITVKNALIPSAALRLTDQITSTRGNPCFVRTSCDSAALFSLQFFSKNELPVRTGKAIFDLRFGGEMTLLESLGRLANEEPRRLLKSREINGQALTGRYFLQFDCVRSPGVTGWADKSEQDSFLYSLIKQIIDFLQALVRAIMPACAGGWGMGFDGF